MERGEIASHRDPFRSVSTAFRANLFWMGRRPLEQGPEIYHCGSPREKSPARWPPFIGLSIPPIWRSFRRASRSTRNQVAELTLRVKAPLAFDLSSSFESTGRFVLVDEYDIAGGGIITELVHDEQEVLREEARQREYRVAHRAMSVAEDRAMQYGHRAAIVLFTGSAQTGKSFLATTGGGVAGRR